MTGRLPDYPGPIEINKEKGKKKTTGEVLN